MLPFPSLLTSSATSSYARPVVIFVFPHTPMKSILPLALRALSLVAGFAIVATAPCSHAADVPKSAPAPKLLSDLYDWEKMVVTSTAKGVRRDVFDGPTATVDKMHCHITTLNPGEKSGEPSLHRQEEVIIVKEGLVEVGWDGKTKTGGPGSVIFLAAGATTFLRNAGTTPCTYIVIYYYTPLTPKS